MKKVLLVGAWLLISAAQSAVQGQACSFGNVGVQQYGPPQYIDGKCVVTISLYFDIDHNAGGKFFWFHIWPASNYHGPWSYKTDGAPTLANGMLTNTVANFGYWHKGSALTLQTIYPPDPNIPYFQSTSLTISEIEGPVYDRYTVTGLKVYLPLSCDISQPLKIDAWESQAENGSVCHCEVQGVDFNANDPLITAGLLFCEVPRAYKFNIQTLSLTSKTYNYEVRIDNGDGIFNATVDTPVIGSGSATMVKDAPFQSGKVTYPGIYGTTKPWADRAIWIVVLKNTTDLANDIYYRIDNTCSPLPVKWTSFTAQRLKEQVRLDWSTATEQNNTGFFIERRNGEAAWTVQAFVPTAASGGNSESLLNYQWSERNTLPGVSQYRLRQVDLDGRAAYSDIKLVKGMQQEGLIQVFPNPTQDGSVHVVINGQNNPVDIQVVDMNGRIVRQVLNTPGNEIRISGLSSGIYTLRVRMRETSTIVSTKLMVQQ